MTDADQQDAFNTALAVTLLEAVDAVEAGDLTLHGGTVTVSLTRASAARPTKDRTA